MPKVALITGIAGQDGQFLSAFLRTKGYEIHGLVRPERSVADTHGCHLHYAEIGAASNLAELLAGIEPDEIYHLAGLSRVSASFADPVGFARVNGLGTVQLLDAIVRERDRSGRDMRFYQASTSEMFGPSDAPLNEQAPLKPRSPYGCSKAFAHLQTINYRAAFGLFACCGILFNHESPRRPEHFVTRKITATAARIKLGRADCLSLGNVDIRRDWGFAGDYVEAMWLMLQQDQPDDYVIATGQTHTVREFADTVFNHLGLDLESYLAIDPSLLRPTDVACTCGDASKAARLLGWKPRVSFRELAQRMADADLRLAREAHA